MLEKEKDQWMEIAKKQSYEYEEKIKKIKDESNDKVAKCQRQ